MGRELLSLFGGEPHVHLKELQKTMEEKTEDDNWIFLFLCSMDWQSQRGSTLHFLGEKHCASLISLPSFHE